MINSVLPCLSVDRPLGSVRNYAERSLGDIGHGL